MNRVRAEHLNELKRKADEVDRMVKAHNADIDRKDTEIRRHINEAVD